MSNELRIDARGFNAVYNGRTYVCLQIHPYNEISLMMDGFTYYDVEMLCVAVINPDGQFEILDGISSEFHFVKE